METLQSKNSINPYHTHKLKKLNKIRKCIIHSYNQVLQQFHMNFDDRALRNNNRLLNNKLG